MRFARCAVTGRRWIEIGGSMFAVGFGPDYFIERVWIAGRLRFGRINGKLRRLRGGV
jgi:hypothetical protein